MLVEVFKGEVAGCLQLILMKYVGMFMENMETWGEKANMAICQQLINPGEEYMVVVPFFSFLCGFDIFQI